MLILDLFAGTGSSTQAFLDAGDEVISVELNPEQPASIHADILDLDALDLAGYGQFDFIWASPPCTAFSVASMGHHWDSAPGDEYDPKVDGYIPKTPEASHNQLIVSHTVQLMLALGAPYWLIENPVGMLRVLPPVAALPRVTVTYCQYGDSRMKPTDLFTNVPISPSRCKNGDACHERAPRGSHEGGTQGVSNLADRSRVPYGLGAEIREILTSENRGASNLFDLHS